MKTLIAILYLTLAPLTYAAALANFQSVGKSMAAENCRQDMGFAALWALFPPDWFVVPFVSGFYEHGLQWICHSHIAVGNEHD
jgi:hypothetical protein